MFTDNLKFFKMGILGKIPSLPDHWFLNSELSVNDQLVELENQINLNDWDAVMCIENRFWKIQLDQLIEVDREELYWKDGIVSVRNPSLIVTTLGCLHLSKDWLDLTVEEFSRKAVLAYIHLIFFGLDVLFNIDSIQYIVENVKFEFSFNCCLRDLVKDLPDIYLRFLYRSV